MCLFKTHRFPKISRKPIKCYKAVRYISGNTYETCVKRHPFKLGDIIKSARSWIFSIFNDSLTNEVVHAYRVKDTVFICNATWIECEIPPFTFYWTGHFDEIGAARIKTIKVV